jgi:hypothetical protein
MASCSLTFAQSDLTRPYVASVSPANYSISLDAGAIPSALFSEAMNASTINSATIELRNTITNALVPATIVYYPATKTVKLFPNSTFSWGLLYTAKVKGGTSGVKDLAGNAMSADYSWYFLVLPLFDLTAPTILSVSPANGATGVNTSTPVTAILSEEMLPSSVNASTVELRTAANVLVPAVISYNNNTRTINLQPSAPLAGGAVYKATVKGGTSGVKDESGNCLAASYTWSFTTLAPDLVNPSVLSVSPANNATGIGLGATVSALFSESMNAATINTSTVELRKGSVLVGSSLAYNSSTKTVTLTPTSALESSVVYTAKVKGGTSGVKDMSGNALTTDYTWSFTTADLIAPTVSPVSPLNNETGVSVGVSVSGLFSEAVNASTINVSTVQLKDASNTIISGSVIYNPSNKTVTFSPSTILLYSTVYTVTIKGGVSGVKDVAGNAMVNNFSWSFTTTTPPNSTTISIFDPSVLPDYPAAIDQKVEVGVKFRSSVDGFIKGLRFYKGLANTGTHIGHLWTREGILLDEVTFVDETESGWQQVMFPSPIAISANTTYVASYFSSAGIYAYTNNYFTDPVVNGPLTALADGQDGGNGLYSYSPMSTFPVSTYWATNYFVDVLFTEYTGPDLTAPTVISATPANHATGIALNSTAKAFFSEPMNVSTINSSTVELRNSSNALVAATITYNTATNSAILTPSSPLAYATVYTAKVKGGIAGVKDAAGNPLVSDYTWTFTTTDPPMIAVTEGTGGPILVLSSTANPFSRYTVEILRAEGLNHFAAADISTIDATVLNNYDVVVLGEVAVNATQVTLLTNWVNAGGTLIGFRPSSLLNGLFGLSAASGTLKDKYLLVNTASGPGVGIVNQTMQFHGTANLHTITPGSGAASIATFYSTATTATSNPAVTLRTVGASGGKAVAFTYDLARSIVYTRQGNPEWAGQKRDGQIDPVRSDDMFFGGSSPDWIDFNKVAIPQADEQQRLLANIIIQGNLHRKPLPRFWYLPGDEKAAIVMTGDDHMSGGTVGRFNQYKDLLPAYNTAQDVLDWKTIRGTSYVYPNTPISNQQAMAFEQQGFEIALHPDNNCVNYTMASLQNTFSTQLSAFASGWPGLRSPATNRTHCLVWSDWASTPKVELQNGIRFDVTYYYWPEVWMQNRPGMFTGSGMPMRFADLDGSLIDVYQAPTQMTDETNMNYTAFCNTVLDKATGAEGYYGVFTANMHTDQAQSAGSDAIIASAIAHDVPVVSSKQMLTWLDGRNNSSFSSMVWNNNQLTFNATARIDARNIKGMLPFYSQTGQLVAITRNGSPVSFTTQTIKGIQYAFFAVAAGTSSYVATYNAVLRTAAPKDSAENRLTDITTAKEESPASTTATETAPAKQQEEKPVLAEIGLYAKAFPNPSTSYFNIVLASSDATTITVRVVDITGRVIENHQKVSSTGILRIGHNWTGGTYFVEVLQGDQRRVLKIVKTN